MARKAFQPTEGQRQLVKVMSAYGIRQEDIATEVGLRSPKTLRKHFREDLDHGRIGANIKVAKTLYAMATSGRQVLATMHWLNLRAGWRRRPVLNAGPATIPDFVVVLDKEGA